MAENRFTKQEADRIHKVVEELLVAFPKSKKMDYLGHFNDILLFIESVKRVAPDETSK